MKSVESLMSSVKAHERPGRAAARVSRRCTMWLDDGISDYDTERMR